MARNVFVLGLDELNHEILRQIPHLSEYRFEPLLTVDELTGRHELDFTALLDRAQRQLENFDGPIDAIVGYWDFPVSSLVPILCRRLGLRAPPLEAVVKCEHKYWSRLEQQKVVDDLPRFALVDLATDPEVPPTLEMPMWLKPVKSFSSELAYKVHNRTEFDRAVEEIHRGVGKIGGPFEEVLSFLDLPPEIGEVGGKACLAEEAVEGYQVTVEGYSTADEVRTYGVIDSVNYPDSSSFLRYQYPSTLPNAVQERLITSSKRLIRQMGLMGSTFNIEYFWNPETDAINVIEINPRLSQSHARLFTAVDGFPNHLSMIQLALGEEPESHDRAGDHTVAGKWFYRRFSDGLVRRTPTRAELDRIEQDIPGTKIKIVPAEGERLSQLPGQDAYSYELADIFIGAPDEDELVARYDRAVRELHFEFDP
ncbi:ATP-grasp domain-containing protein [Parasphingorhabdus pacifica]